MDAIKERLPTLRIVLLLRGEGQGFEIESGFVGGLVVAIDAEAFEEILGHRGERGGGERSGNEDDPREGDEKSHGERTRIFRETAGVERG
jgi:hypothetical protein